MRKSRSYIGMAVAACLCVAVSSCGNRSNDPPSSTIKLKTFQAASVVIGQPDFTQSSMNQGSTTSMPSANSLYYPYGNAFVDSAGTLFVTDTDNSRVLGFKKVSTSNDATANFVLGQSSFTTRVFSDAADGMQQPMTTAGYKGKLLVAEWLNNRVLIWNSAPSTNGVPADVVVGQAGFGTDNSACSAAGMNEPADMAITPGGKLIVTDYGNNRVLIFNHIPTTNGATPDLVLGQNNLTTCVSNNSGAGTSGTSPSASSLAGPSGVWTNGKKLVVVDSSNNRVLIWNTFPNSSFQPADVVLGQPDFACDVANNDGTGCTSGSGPSAQNLNRPFVGVYSNGTQLFVADNLNNRVLIWNTFPNKNFQPADVVLGQPDFTCGAADNDGSGCTSGSASSALGFDFPTGVYQSGDRLFVSDTNNNRELVFKGQ